MSLFCFMPNTNGHVTTIELPESYRLRQGKKQLEPIAELSLQRRAQENTLGGIYSWWFTRPYDEWSEIAPYWSVQRDYDLRNFAIREGNDILTSAISSMVKWGRTLAWVVEGPDRVVNRYQSTLSEAEFGQGWGDLMAKALWDYYTQDKGATIELIGAGDPSGPLQGPVLGLAHLDSQYIQPTGDLTYPVLFHNPKDGYSHKIHASRVIRIVDMPSPNELLCGIGFCAVSRVIASSQVLMKLARYKNEKLSDMPEAGLLLLNNIMPGQWDDAKANHERNRRKLGEEIWSNIMTLFSIDPAQPATADLVSFAGIPDGFDELTSTDIYISIVALSFGVDAREFWPMNQGRLGSSGEAEVQSEKTEGKGRGDVIAAFERAINWKVLPSSVNFRFDFRDDKQDKLAAEINKQKTESIWRMWDSEAYRAGFEPPVSALEIRQMLADNVPDYFKPEFLEVQATDEEELTDTEREANKALGPNVIIRSDGTRVKTKGRKLDRILQMAEENYKAGRIDIDSLTSYRFRSLLDENNTA